MQVNEHAEQARQGKRLPDIDRAFDDTRAKPESRAKRLGADESRRPATRPPTRSPAHYGAGF
jgi:hypothetical protein